MSNSNQSRKICKLIKYYQNNQSLDFPDCKCIILLYDYIVHFHCMEDFHLGMIYLAIKKTMSYIFISKQFFVKYIKIYLDNCFPQILDHICISQLCHHKGLGWSMNHQQDNQTLFEQKIKKMFHILYFLKIYTH